MKTNISLCFVNHIAEYYVNEDKQVLPIDFKENFSINSAEIFIKSILEFNGLELDNNFINALNNADDDIGLEGGLHFSTPTAHIYPSCCSDFFDWTEMINDIKAKTSPWMGHDPSPNIEYFEKTFTVFSDEKENSTEIFDISFKFSELDFYVRKILTNIEYSIPIISSWVNQNSSLDVYNFEIALRNYMKGKVI